MTFSLRGERRAPLARSVVSFLLCDSISLWHRIGKPSADRALVRDHLAVIRQCARREKLYFPPQLGHGPQRGGDFRSQMVACRKGRRARGSLNKQGHTILLVGPADNETQPCQLG